MRLGVLHGHLALAAALLLSAGMLWWWPWQGGPPRPERHLWAGVTLLAALVTLLSAAWWLRVQATAWLREQQDNARRRGAALKRARQLQRALVDHSDAVVISLDRQGRYLDMNRRGLDFLGVELEEISGKYLEEHLDENSAARFRRLWQQALEQGELSRRREPLVIAGRERYLDLYLRPIGGPREDRVLLILRDQTEQKLMDDKLWQTEKLASLGLLAAGVAHQLNNPLGVLLGFCELLLERTPANDPAHRELKIIQQQGRQCQQIVQGLLKFTRLSDLGRSGGDLLTGLQAVLDTLEGVLRRQNIELTRRLPTSLPPSPADGGGMQQVFLNLMANAMDAMPRGGRLLVEARLATKPPRQGTLHGTLPEGERYIEIVIEDSGPGIAPEHLPHIYDPFFTTKPVGKGTGLGLSVAYGIVREHHGTITCQSPLPGQPDGTRFTVRLPVRRRDDEKN